MITFREALISLQPLGEWTVNDNDINQMVWLSPNIPQPTISEIEAEIIRLQTEEENKLQAQIAAKQSALNKLMALGLTEEEALALGK